MFVLLKTINEEMEMKCIEELLDLKKIKEVIRTREHLSSPEKEKLNRPIIKIERESAARMMIETMEIILESGIYSQDWSGAHTILIYKGEDKSDHGNWRPITIFSIIYKSTFCRISQSLYQIHEDESINLYYSEQKSFISRRAECMENIAIANALINDAIVETKTVLVFSLDLRDNLRNISHDLINFNMKKIGISDKIKN
jgi:hypothetical protein